MRTKNGKRFAGSVGAIVLAGLLALPSPLLAQGIDTVRIQLIGWTAEGYDDGYVPTHEAKLGTLYDGYTASVDLVLLAGWTYRIVGACDEDCSDLDFTLYDEFANIVVVNYLPDATPVVEITPRWSGPFTLEVDMQGCDFEPCFYGVSVLGAPLTSF